MADESGAAGVAKGLTKTLTSRMWDGTAWRMPGEMLGAWLTGIVKTTPHVCAYCQHQIAMNIRQALVSGPTADEIEEALR